MAVKDKVTIDLMFSYYLSVYHFVNKNVCVRVRSCIISYRNVQDHGTKRA